MESVYQKLQDVTPVSRETFEKFQLYVSLLQKWQKKINLVASATLPDVWERHMIDSLQIQPIIESFLRSKLSENTVPTLLDFGSGAGFPGMILAMTGKYDVHLMESDTRKTAFLREVARQTQTKLTCHNKRIEQIDPFPADIITARGFAALGKILHFGQRFYHPETGYILLKGEKAATEIAEAEMNWTLSHISTPSMSDPRGVVLTVEKVMQK